MKDAKISVVIVTFNEEKNIERCIRSVLPVADEIIVWDSYSSDSTKEICLLFGATVFQEPWAGFSESKNKANEKATGDFILSIDADEALGEDLVASILKFKKENQADIGEVKRLTNFCGQWIYHGGWYPEYKVRILRNGFATWAGIVHEELTFSEPFALCRLEGTLYHYSYPSIDSHVKKISKYSFLAAQKDFEAGKKRNLFVHGILKPFFTFFKKYFLQLGFLDGYYGFVIAVHTAFERFLRLVHFVELKKNR
jgi:glycosyltransferase involved in cell wall biosynthesis